MEIKRILVPLDLSPLGEAKLPVAEAQARAFGAELLLLHTVPELDPSGAVSADEANARTYLDTVAARMHAEGLRVIPIVRAGPAALTIVETAREQEADLIVLGSSTRSGLPLAFLGSVADVVVREAPCPVLLVRPRLEAGAAAPLRSFADDAARSGPLSQRQLGLQTVDVARIVGSVGRAGALGADFRPLKHDRNDEWRYQRVLQGMKTGAALPPVELYKLGFGYYVLDGNHRVAAARELGQVEIDAEVTEFIPLSDPEAQRAFAERRAFERATGLTRVEAAHSETYCRLQGLVDEYATASGETDHRAAARRWYTSVYRPLVRRIRQLGLVRRFPGERSADLVVRLADFRRGRLAEAGEDLDWMEALEAFARESGAPARDGRARRALSILGRRRAD